MHVAFGRVRRKSRIFADYTDCADYGIGGGVGGRELSEAGLAGFIGFSGLGVKSRESEFTSYRFLLKEQQKLEAFLC